jgi:hypothetical protein
MSNIPLKYRKSIHIFFFLLVLSASSVVNAFGAASMVGPTSIAVSEGQIFFGEMGGTIRVFDMQTRVVISKVTLPKASKVKLFNDKGRIIAQTVAFSPELYEITSMGNAEKIGDAPR